MLWDINHIGTKPWNKWKEYLPMSEEWIGVAIKDIDEQKNKEKMKEKFKEYILYYGNRLKEVRTDMRLAKKFCELLKKWNQILWQDEKDLYKKLLDEAFSLGNYPWYYWNNIIPELLEIDILSSDDEEYYSNLMEKAIAESMEPNVNLNWYSDWSWYVIPSLLKKHLLSKNKRKEIYKKHLSRCFWKDNYLRNMAVSNMLKIDDVLDNDNQKDVQYYENMLNKAFSTLDDKLSSDYIQLVLAWLIRLWLDTKMIEGDSIKNKYKKVLDSAFKKSETDLYYLRYAVPELLKLKVLNSNEEADREYIKKLTTFAPPSSNELGLSIRDQYVAPELNNLMNLSAA